MGYPLAFLIIVVIISMSPAVGGLLLLLWFASLGRSIGEAFVKSRKEHDQ